MKKALGKTQTLRAACSNAVRRAENFRPAADPFQAVRDSQNLITRRWLLSLPTNPVW